MPLKQSKSPEAFKSNFLAEKKAGKPQKQALAIAYSTKKANMKKMAKGGYAAAPVEGKGDGSDDGMCPVCGMDQSLDVTHACSGGMMAEGGAVDALRPAHASAAQSNYEEEVGDGSAAPGPDRYRTEGSEDYSDSERDFPKESMSLDLASDVMNDRKRRSVNMAEGGWVDKEKATKRPEDGMRGDQKTLDLPSYSQGGMAEWEGAKPSEVSMDTWLERAKQEWIAHQGPKYSQGGVAEYQSKPDHSTKNTEMGRYMDNDGDEVGSFDQDERDSRGMNISQVQTMSDDAHPGMNSDSDASLVDKILQERKSRRRNKY